MDFLTGEDYPHLCQECQAAINAMALTTHDAADTDDPEAPCMAVYDHRLFCGGHQCINKKGK